MRSSKIPTGLLTATAVAAGLGAMFTLGACGSTPVTTHSATESPAISVTPPHMSGVPASPDPAATGTTPDPAATEVAPNPASTTISVAYSVTGDGQPSIMYGPNGSTSTVPGGLGPLGNGVALPWSLTARATRGALFYAVSAQLSEDGGTVTATVTEVDVIHYSGMPDVTSRHVLDVKTASGPYAIVMAEALAQ